MRARASQNVKWDAKNPTFSRKGEFLCLRAHHGERIVVAKAGKPYARFVPLEPRRERTPGPYADEIPDSFFKPLSNEQLEEWEV